MKSLSTLLLSFALLGGGLLHSQEAPKAGAVTPPTVANPDVTTVPPPRAPSKLTPKQQVTGFFAMCKQGKAGEGLREILTTNPVVKEEDVKRVSDAFSEMITTMGAFVDFAITKETVLSERTQVLRCLAHFERQPFVNEFTFYDPGNGEWRLVHLRYDANLATMFQEDLRGATR